MNNREQVSPENLFEGNELICAKLLGWKPTDGGWLKNDGFMYGGCGTPSFTTWGNAGLIMDAFARLGFSYDMSYTQTEDRTMQYGVIVWFPGKRYTVDADSMPAAIRAAALEYVRSQK